MSMWCLMYQGMTAHACKWRHIRVRTGVHFQSCFCFWTSTDHTTMPKSRRNAYDAKFKLDAIKLAEKDGNRRAAQTIGVNESMIRRWRRQKSELSTCSKSKKSFRGHKCRWPALEDELEEWVLKKRAEGRGVSTVQIRLKAKDIAKNMKFESFSGGPSWCFRFMKRKGLTVRNRTTMCQQLPPDFEEKLSSFRNFVQVGLLHIY